MTTWHLVCFLIALAVQASFLHRFLFNLQTTIASLSARLNGTPWNLSIGAYPG